MKWSSALAVYALSGAMIGAWIWASPGQPSSGTLQDDLGDAAVVLLGSLYDASPEAAFAPVKVESVLAGGIALHGTWHTILLARGDTLSEKVLEAEWVDVEFYEPQNGDTLDGHDSDEYTSPEHFASLIGERRIWILREHPAYKCYVVAFPDDCLPMDSLETVERSLKALKGNR